MTASDRPPMSGATIHRWACVEAGCDDAAYSADEDALVAAVMDHIRRAHGSFELEEMILAAIDAAPASRVPADHVAMGTVRVPASWAAGDTIGGQKRSMEWSPERGLDDV